MPRVLLDWSPVLLDSEDKIRLQVYWDLWDDVVVPRTRNMAVWDSGDLNDLMLKMFGGFSFEVEDLKNQIASVSLLNFAELENRLSSASQAVEAYSNVLARLKALGSTTKGVWDSTTWDHCTWDDSFLSPNIYAAVLNRMKTLGE